MAAAVPLRSGGFSLPVSYSPFRLQKTFMPTSRQYSHKFLPFYTDTDKEQ